MNKPINPIQIPIKPCCNLVVVSCLVTFSALASEPSIGGASWSLYDSAPLALTAMRRYSSFALSKISRLALVGYEYLAHTVRFMDFFCMCNISMRSHVMAKLEGDTFECASYLDYWSTNPFQLCHPYLVVNGNALKSNLGAHTHA
jgi:hypothetical protein